MENKSSGKIHCIAYTSCFWIILILASLVIFTVKGGQCFPPDKRVEQTKLMRDIFDAEETIKKGK